MNQEVIIQYVLVIVVGIFIISSLSIIRLQDAHQEIKLLQEIVALDYDRSCDYIVSE